MGFTFMKKLPSPAEIRNEYPIDAEIQALKDKRDQEIRDVFTGKSDKFLAIIGPCSADNEEAVIDYLQRLRTVPVSYTHLDVYKRQTYDRTYHAYDH